MDCYYQIPLINISELATRLVTQDGPRIAATGSIEVTARCNLACGHCYIREGADNPAAVSEEMSTRELFRLFDEIADAGCLWLLITGGEPLIRADFRDLYLYAVKKGFLITLFTNGTTITPQIGDLLAEWPPRRIEITLYGRREKTYEQVTGVRGSYGQCMRGIELLRQRGLKLGLKSLITRTNVHELPAMRLYAKEIGLEYRFDPVLNMRIDGDPAPGGFRLNPEEVVQIEQRDPDRAAMWTELCERPPMVDSRRDYALHCGAGQHSFHVDQCGRLSVCMMARQRSFSLRSGTFREGWEEFIPLVRSEKCTKETKCRTCELGLICDQCAGWAFMESGDAEQPVEYLCRIAHLRAEAFASGTSHDNGGEGHDGRRIR
jgi:radical SAM protein with 4Fe4S-binding SPASM domain